MQRSSRDGIDVAMGGWYFDREGMASDVTSTFMRKGYLLTLSATNPLFCIRNAIYHFLFPFFFFLLPFFSFPFSLI